MLSGLISVRGMLIFGWPANWLIEVAFWICIKLSSKTIATTFQHDFINFQAAELAWYKHMTECLHDMPWSTFPAAWTRAWTTAWTCVCVLKHISWSHESVEPLTFQPSLARVKSGYIIVRIMQNHLMFNTFFINVHTQRPIVLCLGTHCHRKVKTRVATMWHKNM